MNGNGNFRNYKYFSLGNTVLLKLDKKVEIIIYLFSTEKNIWSYGEHEVRSLEITQLINRIKCCIKDQ